VGKSAEKLWKAMQKHPRNLRFSDFCKVIRWFGFQKKGRKGSHQTYFLSGIREILDIQPLKGEAKPYQIKQLIKLVKEHKLQGGSDEKK